MIFSVSPLAEILQDTSAPEWKVSEDNVFMMIKKGYVGYETRPNWALIIPLFVVAVATIIAISILLYRSWVKKNTLPVRISGKTKHVRVGYTIKQACIDALIEDWLLQQKIRIEANGLKVLGWFTDPNLQIPLDINQPIYAPVTIFPKVKKK